MLSEPATQRPTPGSRMSIEPSTSSTSTFVRDRSSARCNRRSALSTSTRPPRRAGTHWPQCALPARRRGGLRGCGRAGPRSQPEKFVHGRGHGAVVRHLGSMGAGGTTRPRGVRPQPAPSRVVPIRERLPPLRSRRVRGGVGGPQGDQLPPHALYSFINLAAVCGQLGRLDEARTAITTLKRDFDYELERIRNEYASGDIRSRFSITSLKDCERPGSRMVTAPPQEANQRRDDSAGSTANPSPCCPSST